LIGTMDLAAGPRFLPRWAVADVIGAVVAVDVLRAFTTAAYAFAAGARHIVLVDSVEEALAFKSEHPDSLAMGEDRGRRVDGFDFSNSPVEVAAADLDDRVLVQRTSAGTRGVVAARSATRLWCASLVCASATATAVRSSGLGHPTYVITGRNVGDRSGGGDDDVATAELIERARMGIALDADRTSEFVANCDEARRTLAHGPGHASPDDVAFATKVDLFDFAMEVRRIDGRLRLERSKSKS
jgi:2-phosphosulfolactate phosphatase